MGFFLFAQQRHGENACCLQHLLWSSTITFGILFLNSSSSTNVIRDSFYMRVRKAFIELWWQDFAQEMCRTFGMHNAIENVSSSLDTFSCPRCLNVRCHSEKASSIWGSSAAISSLPRFWSTTETWTLQLPARQSSCCSEISAYLLMSTNIQPIWQQSLNPRGQLLQPREITGSTTLSVFCIVICSKSVCFPWILIKSLVGADGSFTYS